MSRATRTRTGRALVLAIATATMIIEMTSLLTGHSIYIGTWPLSASTVPSLILLGVLGARSVGQPAGDPDRAAPFWVAMAAGLVLGALLFARTGDLIDLPVLLLAAINEEVVYRFAVPVVITTALMVLRAPPLPARLAGYTFAGIWWVVLPGHQAQGGGSAGSLAVYAAFAIISALVVARSRALIPMAVAHCVLNVVTVADYRGEISPAGRGVLSACLLFLLVGTYAWPSDRALRRLARTATTEPPTEDLIEDVVIDLRDGERPAITKDGETIWIDEPAPAPVPGAVEEPTPPAASATRSDGAGPGSEP
jgi:hypothetical protein